MLTKAFKWVETRLDEGAWFRRCYVLAATVLVWNTTTWAQAFAVANAHRPGLEVAAIIGAVAAIPGLIVTFAFNQYLQAKRG